MFLRYVYLLLFLFCLRSGLVFTLPLKTYPYFILPKSSGLSQAVTATADSQTALYYNPAGLRNSKSSSYEVINPYLVYSDGALTVDKKFINLRSLAYDLPNSIDDLNTFEKQLQELSGESYHAELALSPYYTCPSFGIGLMVHSQLDFNVNNLTPDLAHFYIPNDIEIRGAYAFTFFDDRLYLGLGSHLRLRLLFEKELSIYEVNNFTRDQVLKSVTQGLGLGFDFGMLVKPFKNFLNPKIGFSILNLGKTRFHALPFLSKHFSNSPPSPLLESINMGFAISPEFGLFFSNLALDFRNINFQESFNKKLHLGLEIGLKKSFVSLSLLTGYSQGGFSYGMDLDLILLKIRISSYMAEDELSLNQKSQRRLMVGVNFLL